MKKITLLVATFLLSIGVFAQSTTKQEYESLKKNIEKNTEDLKDERKMSKANRAARIWKERGDLFYDAYLVNTKALYVGLPKEGFTGAETLVGKPNEKNPGKKIGEETYEEWVYDRVILYFKDGKLAKWKETKPIDEAALDKAKKAYNKALELDEKDKYKKDIQEKLENISQFYFNEGVEAYNDGDFKQAYKGFKSTVETNKHELVSKVDTSAIFNTGLAAEKAGMYDEALKYYNKSQELDYRGADIYFIISNVYKAKGDTLQAFNAIQKGFEEYPGNNALLIEMINYYLQTGDTDAALKYLSEAIEKEPENETFHFAQGTLYDKIQQNATEQLNDLSEQITTAKQENKSKDEIAKLEKALEKLETDKKPIIEENVTKALNAYKKAIELKQDFFDAYYNAGAIYYNQAARMFEKAARIPLGEQDKYKAAMEKAKSKLKEAKPFMEKAHELNPDDMSTMQTLRTIYQRLQMKEKAKEFDEKIEAISQ